VRARLPLACGPVMRIRRSAAGLRPVWIGTFDRCHPGDRPVDWCRDRPHCRRRSRLTGVQDNLAHVLDRSHTDETSGTWTGLACPGHGLALGTDVDNATLRHLAAGGEIADRLWEDLQAIWSRAWSANYAVLEFMQGTGLTRFAPVKPQHWVVASCEHHTSLHGLPCPHIHNIAVASLTTAGTG
jgi:hypothetical protein